MEPVRGLYAIFCATVMASKESTPHMSHESASKERLAAFIFMLEITESMGPSPSPAAKFLYFCRYRVVGRKNISATSSYVCADAELESSRARRITTG